MNFNEENFKTRAEQEISRCRPGDWNHALRVVEWAKQLGKDRKDLPLLVSAAYIHDIGWRDVLPKDEKITFDKLLEFEKQANDNSENFVSEFLKSLEYSPGEKLMWSIVWFVPPMHTNQKKKTRQLSLTRTI